LAATSTYRSNFSLPLTGSFCRTQYRASAAFESTGIDPDGITEQPISISHFSVGNGSPAAGRSVQCSFSDERKENQRENSSKAKKGTADRSTVAVNVSLILPYRE
jgi:hypothetical protein